jgi:hypothetical protein
MTDSDDSAMQSDDAPAPAGDAARPGWPSACHRRRGHARSPGAAGCCRSAHTCSGASWSCSPSWPLLLVLRQTGASCGAPSSCAGSSACGCASPPSSACSCFPWPHRRRCLNSPSCRCATACSAVAMGCLSSGAGASSCLSGSCCCWTAGTARLAAGCTLHAPLARSMLTCCSHEASSSRERSAVSAPWRAARAGGGAAAASFDSGSSSLLTLRLWPALLLAAAPPHPLAPLPDDAAWPHVAPALALPSPTGGEAADGMHGSGGADGAHEAGPPPQLVRACSGCSSISCSIWRRFHWRCHCADCSGPTEPEWLSLARALAPGAAAGAAAAGPAAADEAAAGPGAAPSAPLPSAAASPTLNLRRELRAPGGRDGEGLGGGVSRQKGGQGRGGSG